MPTEAMRVDCTASFSSLQAKMRTHSSWDRNAWGMIQEKKPRVAATP